MYKKVPRKQVTYHTPKKVEKQLDYILTDRKHYSWSRDAEANDTIHMGSDHRCVMAKFEIPKDEGKSRHTKAPMCEWESETCEEGNEQKYRNLEQEVKEAEPGTSKESKTKEATDAKAKAMEQKSEAEEAAAPAASAASFASTAAADGQSTTKTHAEALEGAVASGAQETTEKDTNLGHRTRKENHGEARQTTSPWNQQRDQKNIPGKTKGRKDKKESRRFWKNQGNEEHSQYQINEEADLDSQRQKQRRWNYQNETKNCQRFWILQMLFWFV